MKKIIISIFTLSLILSANQVWAIDLDKIVGMVDSATSDQNNNPQKKSASPLAAIQNDLINKVEGKVDKIVGKIEAKIDKFDKKFDEYENKIDKAEKATDRIISAINNFDSSQIQKYIVMAKYGAIAFVSLLVLLIILLVSVSVQLCKVNSLLKNKK